MKNTFLSPRKSLILLLVTVLSLCLGLSRAQACGGGGDVALPGEEAVVMDTDGDGVPDGSDNCPYIPNSDQTDTNDNGIGDACEEMD